MAWSAADRPCLTGLFWATICLLPGPGWAEPPQGNALRPGEFICCHDNDGRRTCGDLLPPQCAGRAYKVYSQHGTVVREVGPPMSPEEKARAREQARLQKQAEIAAQEQKRKDQALLETYTSLEDIDRMQARAEEDVQKAIAEAQTRINAAQQRRLRFANEAEFYPNRPLPPEVAKGLRDEDAEIKSQNELIEAKQRELAQINHKYAEDRRRYIELSRRPRR